MVVKIIQKYLKGTKDYGFYCKKNDNFELRVYILMQIRLEMLMIKRVQAVELSF